MWYVGFAFVISLLIYFPQNDYKLLIVSLSTIAVVAVLLIFTFRESKRLNRKKVVFYGIIPIGVVAILFVLSYTVQNNIQYEDSIKLLSSDKVELFDLIFTIENAQLGKRASLSGRIKNNSESEINRFIVNVKIHKLNKPPDNKIYTAEDIFRLEPTNQIHIDSLPDTLKKYVERVIDSETFYSDLFLDSGEVKSFEMESYPSSLRPTSEWVWSYQIESIWSGSLE